MRCVHISEASEGNCRINDNNDDKNDKIDPCHFCIHGWHSCWCACILTCFSFYHRNPAQYLYISASADNYADSILELVLTDSEGQTITPINSQQYEALFDEQDEFEGRSSEECDKYVYCRDSGLHEVHEVECEQ